MTITIEKKEHIQDSDCTLDSTDTCIACGVYHGEPCTRCGGRGFHKAGCSEVYEKRICKKGMIAELRKATKEFTCRESGKPILRGEYYYSIYHCGSGVQPHPDRVRPEYLEQLFSEHNDEGYRQVFPWRNRGA